MSLLSAASGQSRWRGYQCCKENKVMRTEPLGEGRFHALVSGSAEEPYDVTIDLEHPRSSVCTCPHAAGKRIVCKHMVAAYFAIFPEESEKFYKELLREEEEWEEYQEERNAKLVQVVRHLKRKDAQDILLDLLETGPDWLREQFIREYVE